MATILGHALIEEWGYSASGSQTVSWGKVWAWVTWAIMPAPTTLRRLQSNPDLEPRRMATFLMALCRHPTTQERGKRVSRPPTHISHSPLLLWTPACNYRIFLNPAAQFKNLFLCILPILHAGISEWSILVFGLWIHEWYINCLSLWLHKISEFMETLENWDEVGCRHDGHYCSVGFPMTVSIICWECRKVRHHVISNTDPELCHWELGIQTEVKGTCGSR
jgi:hypothetical protein